MIIRRNIAQTASLVASSVVLFIINGVTGVLAAHVRTLRLRGLSPRTVEQRVMVVQLVERFLGRPAETASEADLDAWQGQMGLLSPATRRSYVSQAQCYYRWLAAEELIERDPSGVLVRPRVPAGLPRPIRESDLAQALRQVPEVVRVWLALACFAGLRASEIAGLRREDILDDVPRPMIRVRGKGNRERVVPMPPMLWQVLCDFGLPHRGVIFRRPDGRAETGKRVSAAVSRWLRRLGIRATAHQGRHRYATRLLAEGEDIRVIQAVLGHRSLTSTQVYTAVEPTVAWDSAARIDHPLEG